MTTRLRALVARGSIDHKQQANSPPTSKQENNFNSLATMPKYNFDDCYDELDLYCSAIRSGDQYPLSSTMRKVIKDTAIVNAEDPYWDDGSYNQYIPHQIRGKCSTRDALTGLRTLFTKIHEAYSTKKNPTPEKILQMLYGNGYNEWDYTGPAEKYLDAGGSVEDALEAVCQLAQIAVGDGLFDEDEGDY